MDKNKTIAISASLAVLLIAVLSTNSAIAIMLDAMFLLVAMVFWRRSSVKDAWKPREIAKGHLYRYYGSADHAKKEPNLERLLMGALRIKSVTHGDKLYEATVSYKKYNPGLFKIDVVTDLLVVGEKYYGDIFELGGKPTATLRRVVQN